LEIYTWYLLTVHAEMYCSRHCDCNQWYHKYPFCFYFCFYNQNMNMQCWTVHVELVHVIGNKIERRVQKCTINVEVKSIA
jgi:hypothetical protein